MSNITYRYKLYCYEELIGEDLSDSEVGKMIGLDSKKIKNYADNESVRDGKYRIKFDFITEDQMKRFDEYCKAFKLIKSGRAVIRNVTIKGITYKKTVVIS